MKKNEWLVEMIGPISLLTIIVVFILFMITVISGCEESQKAKPTIVTDPMSVILKLPDNWKAKYGDSSESVLVYNMVVLDYMNTRNHQLIIKSIADPNDPNNIESRLRKLESKAIMDGSIIRGVWTQTDPNYQSPTLSPMYIYKVDSNDPNK